MGRYVGAADIPTGDLHVDEPVTVDSRRVSDGPFGHPDPRRDENPTVAAERIRAYPLVCVAGSQQ